MNQKSIGQYPSASKLATAAFVLANLTVVFTLLLWIVFVGLIVANTGSTTCRGILYDPYSGYRKFSVFTLVECYRFALCPLLQVVVHNISH